MELAKIPCTLIKVSQNVNNLRTKEVKGYCTEVPEEGKSFGMVAPALTPGSILRAVITSPVQKLTKTETEDKKIIYTLETMNSTYTVEVSMV